MSFGEAIRSFFRKYMDMTGRASRSEFWWCWAFSTGMMAVFIWGGMYFASTTMFNSMPTAAKIGVGVFFVLPVLAILPPTHSVWVRRFHDTGRSGWSMLWSQAPVYYQGDQGPNEYGAPPDR
jgi:uncharacterized membrane protein YhaH (DUF805 family)